MLTTGTKVKARLRDSSGNYWAIGRISQVLPADALRAETSFVFCGCDRHGFPIEIGLPAAYILEINEGGASDE